jgi:hypothetical protein
MRRSFSFLDHQERNFFHKKSLRSQVERRRIHFDIETVDADCLLQAKVEKYVGAKKSMTTTIRRGHARIVFKTARSGDETIR